MSKQLVIITMEDGDSDSNVRVNVEFEPALTQETNMGSPVFEIAAALFRALDVSIQDLVEGRTQ